MHGRRDVHRTLALAIGGMTKCLNSCKNKRTPLRHKGERQLVSMIVNRALAAVTMECPDG